MGEELTNLSGKNDEGEGCVNGCFGGCGCLIVGSGLFMLGVMYLYGD